MLKSFLTKISSTALNICCIHDDCNVLNCVTTISYFFPRTTAKDTSKTSDTMYRAGSDYYPRQSEGNPDFWLSSRCSVVCSYVVFCRLLLVVWSFFAMVQLIHFLFGHLFGYFLLSFVGQVHLYLMRSYKTFIVCDFKSI